MLKVQIANRQKRLPVPRPLVRKLLRIAGKEAWPDGELSVALVDHDEMVALNLQFTGRDGDTDVLAFPLDDDMPGEAGVGEIIVCASRAEREARRRGVDPQEELLLYVVHGAAHLLGYDDHSPADRRRMYGCEQEILEKAGVRYVRPFGPRHARHVSVEDSN